MSISHSFPVRPIGYTTNGVLVCLRPDGKVVPVDPHQSFHLGDITLRDTVPVFADRSPSGPDMSDSSIGIYPVGRSSDRIPPHIPRSYLPPYPKDAPQFTYDHDKKEWVRVPSAPEDGSTPVSTFSVRDYRAAKSFDFSPKFDKIEPTKAVNSKFIQFSDRPVKIGPKCPGANYKPEVLGRREIPGEVQKDEYIIPDYTRMDEMMNSYDQGYFTGRSFEAYIPKVGTTWAWEPALQALGPYRRDVQNKIIAVHEAVIVQGTHWNGEQWWVLADGNQEGLLWTRLDFWWTGIAGPPKAESEDDRESALREIADDLEVPR